MRRSLPWVAAVALAALVAHGPIPLPAASSDAEGAHRALRRLVAALEAGELAQLVAWYASDADHRDLSAGERARGRAAIASFLEKGYGRAAGGDVEVVSLRLLTPDVAIAQLTLGSPAGAWPPHLAVVLRHRADGWRLVASRGGGNPDTRTRGLRGE